MRIVRGLICEEHQERKAGGGALAHVFGNVAFARLDFD